MRDHELYFQESLHHRLNNPKSLQMWWRKTAPVQVLLRAELPFIKGFFMGFPLRLSNVNRLICSNAEDLRTSLNPTSIRGWCDTPPWGCLVSHDEYKVREMWWQKLSEVQTGQTDLLFDISNRYRRFFYFFILLIVICFEEGSKD